MTLRKSREKRKLNLLGKIILLINLGVVICLLLAYLSLYVSPERIWILPFFGLIYPYILLINILFVIYWLLRFRLYLMISLGAILLGWNLIGRTVQVETSASELPQGRSFQIMTYNVRNMANNNMWQPNFEIRDAIVEFLLENQPDILTLQEFESVGEEPLLFIDSLSNSLGLPYYKYVQYNEKITDRINAIITFSKFPIVSSFAVEKDASHNFCLVSDLAIKEDTIRLYNIHLESVRFRPEDYTFINDLEFRFEQNENIREGSKSVFNKLRKAYVIRSAQVRELRRSIKSSPYPVIICGDFNDTPCSFSYQMLSRGKNDSFIESGSGLGNTYAGTLPALRIDYILYDEQFDSYGYVTGTKELSDHYPIAVSIGIR